MADILEIDALNELIRAVENYKEELIRNKTLLRNAASICDQAMGSDDIAKKHIAKLEEALMELDHAEHVAQMVAESLITDRNKAIELYESI